MTKYIPLSLLLAFGVKGLVYGTSYTDALCLGILAAVSFLYEKQIQNKELLDSKEQLKEIKVEISLLKKDHETTKSYVTSQKLNGMRSGFNRTAQ